MEIKMVLKENYKDLFHISAEDYEKAAVHYDEYLAIFHDLVNGAVFDRDNLRIRIEDSNPWKKCGYFEGKYKFNSLAGTDCDILAPLLIENIESLEQSEKKDAKTIVQDRFEDFEHAFDGNFINPRVILLGINPKMSSKHDSYGLENTVYKEPFDANRSILKNAYYYGDSSIFYAKMQNDHTFKKIHSEMICKKDKVTPVALWEFFPYASEKETVWQKDYPISKPLKQYFQLKKILPSQIWMVCLLTYAIRSSEKLFLFLRKNNKEFRNNFLNKYFEVIHVLENKQITVLSKKSGSSKYLSNGNVKPFFKGTSTNVRTDTVENFFEDLWGIPSSAK